MYLRNIKRAPPFLHPLRIGRTMMKIMRITWMRNLRGDIDRGHKRSALKGKSMVHIADSSHKSGSHTRQQAGGLPGDGL
jgi:hypothetical protein